MEDIMDSTKKIIRAMLCVFMLHMLFLSCSDKNSPTAPKEEPITETYGIDYEHPEKYIIHQVK